MKNNICIILLIAGVMNDFYPVGDVTDELLDKIMDVNFSRIMTAWTRLFP